MAQVWRGVFAGVVVLAATVVLVVAMRGPDGVAGIGAARPAASHR